MSPDFSSKKLTKDDSEAIAPLNPPPQSTKSPDAESLGRGPSELLNLQFGPSAHRFRLIPELTLDPGDKNSPKGFWTDIGSILRREGSGIPASLSSSLVSLAVLRPVLGLESVRALLEGVGPAWGSAISLGLMTVLWYPIFTYITDPLCKLAARSTGLTPRALTSEREAKDQSSESTKHCQHLASNYWKMYLVGFNLVQFGAQAMLLHSGMSPKVAQTWSSLVANVLWLAPLPFVKFGFERLAEKNVNKTRN